MRYVSPTRGNPYDRGFTDAAASSNLVGIGPHATTTRATITTPAARFSYVQYVLLRHTRVTVAGTPAEYEADAIVLSFQLNRLMTSDNTVNVDRQSLTQNYIHASSMILETTDLSTTGTVSYFLSASVFFFFQ